MNRDLAVVPDAAPPVITTTSMALIENTAASLGHAHKIATALVQTAFAPAHFKGKAEEGAAAILYGAQIGLDPLASLQNIYVISGRPALYARTMSAVVQAAGHRIWTEESTDAAVTVSGQRRGSDVVETVTWTPERAELAGYTSNKKYRTDPQAMLYARAVADVARRIAPDALLGLSYTVEEMQVVETTEAPRARRQSAADVLGTSEAAAQADRPAPPEPSDDAPSTQAVKALWATLTEAGISEDREQRLLWMSNHVGREVTTSKDLSAAEVSQLIDTAKANAEYAAEVMDTAQDEGEVQA